MCDSIELRVGLAIVEFPKSESSLVLTRRSTNVGSLTSFYIEKSLRDEI